jgi:hypothetical protein
MDVLGNIGRGIHPSPEFCPATPCDDAQTGSHEPQCPSIHGRAVGFWELRTPSLVSLVRVGRILELLVPHPQPLPQEWELLMRGS